MYQTHGGGTARVCFGSARLVTRVQVIGSMLAAFAFVAASLLGTALIAAAPAQAAAEKDYGKPGAPIDLVVGYQPYYTESWSGLIMRDKKFYEKYLPKGSTVSFQVGLQGAIIVNGMLAGKVDIGYVGDMPGIVSTSHPEVRDLKSFPYWGSVTINAISFLCAMMLRSSTRLKMRSSGSMARRLPCQREVAPTVSLKRYSSATTSNRPNILTKASK